MKNLHPPSDTESHDKISKQTSSPIWWCVSIYHKHAARFHFYIKQSSIDINQNFRHFEILCFACLLLLLWNAFAIQSPLIDGQAILHRMTVWSGPTRSFWLYHSHRLHNVKQFLVETQYPTRGMDGWLHALHRRRRRHFTAAKWSVKPESSSENVIKAGRPESHRVGALTVLQLCRHLICKYLFII